MTVQFAKYRVKDGDKLDDNFFNRRFSDIDRRIGDVENFAPEWEDQVNKLTGVALTRIDDALRPAFAAVEDLAQLGLIFVAHASHNVTIGTGVKVFAIDAAYRARFAPQQYLTIVSGANPANGMAGNLVSYNKETGDLFVNVTLANGSGTHADWVISVGMIPNLTHETRTDNPHSVTPAQIGAATPADVAQAVQDIIGGAQIDFDTLGEAEARVEALETSIVSKVGNTGNETIAGSKTFSSAILQKLSENDTAWRSTHGFMRGDGSGSEMYFQSLGDGANGVKAIRLNDDDGGQIQYWMRGMPQGAILGFDHANNGTVHTSTDTADYVGGHAVNITPISSTSWIFVTYTGNLLIESTTGVANVHANIQPQWDAGGGVWSTVWKSNFKRVRLNNSGFAAGNFMEQAVTTTFLLIPAELDLVNDRYSIRMGFRMITAGQTVTLSQGSWDWFEIQRPGVEPAGL